MSNAVFRCVKCQTNLEQDLKCRNCNEQYIIQDGVYNFLKNPNHDVKKELIGMAIENGHNQNNFLEFTIFKNKSATSFNQKLESTKNSPNQYYQQTLTNFNQALRTVQSKINFKNARVLEIGSGYDYPFLNKCRDLGSECYAINLHFDITDDEQYKNYPIKVLADMNQLPFKEKAFDLIIISATSHHSNTPEKLISEIHRVLKINGVCLMINDPIKGSLKSLGSRLTHQRDSHINENEYTLSKYNRMFKENEFEIQHLFSEYHDQKLQIAVIDSQIRFALIAKIIAKIWKIKIIRNFLKTYGLSFAQSVLGFPMNVVLIKKN